MTVKMNWRKFRQQSLWAVGAVALMFGYMNCGQQSFAPLESNQDASSLSNPALGDGTTTPDAGTPAGGTPVPTPAPPAGATPVPGTTPTPTPTPVVSTKVDVFLATGKIGRTIMSCDNGATWINDRSDSATARCWQTGDPNEVECDHDARSLTGTDFSADGWFYTQLGWGYDGTIRRSRDGRTWETVRRGGWGGGLAVVNNIVVSFWEAGWARSTNQGVTWTAVNGVMPMAFDHPFVYRVGQKLLALGRRAGELAVSLDAGATWRVAPTFQAAWSTASFAENTNGVLVSTGTRYGGNGVASLGLAARSVDNGATWTTVNVFSGREWSSNIVFDGRYFSNFSGDRRYQSEDGITWTFTPYRTSNMAPLNVGGLAVSYNPRTSTFVGITSGWDEWYTRQRAFRSTDGVTWTQLDATRFTGGHPISKITLGEVDRSACP